MAEMEKTEFTFPDEVDEQKSRAGSKVVTPEADDPEIEVVDDTPEQDRGRRPMVEQPKEMTDDELSKYDDSVRKRIQHFTKGYHEERRAKEAALREREEAVKLAHQIVEENKKLKGSLHQGQAALLEQAKRAVAIEVDDAKRLYKEAYETGDSDALVQAQEQLTVAKMRAEKLGNIRPTPLQQNETDVQIPTQQAPRPQEDPKLRAWQDQNPWFGSNRKMTAFALGLHEDLVSEGYTAGSDDYYKAINTEMQNRFSDAFESEKPQDAKSPARTSNVVAPATRSTAPRKIVLTKTQVELAKRLGLTNEQYARAVAEEMRK
jgi:hypothetical protein